LDGADPAGTGTPPASGATVSTWNDKSGNGKNATATGTPTYLTGGGVNFNGSSYFLNQTFTMNISQRSIFIVMQETSHTDVAGVFPLIPTPNSGNDFQSTTGLSIETSGGLCFYGNNGGYISFLGSSSLLVKGIYNDNMNGTTGSGFFNGTNATNETANYTAGTCSGYGIGGRWIGGSMIGSYRLNGVVHEILVYNSALTTSQRQQVEGYLAHKWGLVPPPPTTPLTIPGCQLWLDAADSSTITLSSSKVTQWNDKSGNGYNFTQATSGNQPTYSSASLNSLNTITFTSANSTYLLGTASTNFMGTNSLSVYGIFKTNNSTSGSSVFSKALYGSASGRILYGYRDPGTPGTIVGGIGGNQGSNVYTAISDTYTGGAWRVFGFVSDRSGWTNTTYQNGISIGSTTITANTTTNLTNAFPMLVGAYNNSTGGANPPQAGYYLDGGVGELLVFSTALTTTQRQTIEQYLSRKWGIGSSSIPSTHPFYSIRPHLRAFQPTDVPGCQLWLDADDASNFTGSTWNDKSGTNNHAVNGTPGTSSMPTVTTWSNGRRAARFVKESKNSIKTTNSIPLYVTYFIVARVQDVIGATGFGLLMVNNYDGQRQLRTNSTSFPVSVFYFTQTGGTNMVLGSFSQGQEFLFSGTVTSDSAIGYSNGVQCGTSGVNPNTIPSRHYFGSGDGDAAYVSADFGEILIYDSILTTSQRQQVEGYLAHKWGLTPTYASNTPLTIPGCQLWLDGADSSSLVLSGSNVTQWNDKSGNGFNGTVVNASVGSPIAPSYVTNSINGLPAITMSGTSYFQGTTNVNGTVCTSFFVGSCTFGTGGSSQQRLLAIGELGLDDYSVAARCILLQVYSSGTKACPFRAGVFPTVTIENSSINLYSVIFDGTNASIYLNGNTPVSLASSGSFITNIYAVGSDAGTQFMGGTSSLGTNCLVGKIGEILVYNTALTASQRQQVEGYLARKWGISISATLPSPHPFKSFPPASLPFSPRNISGLQLWLDAADQGSMALSGSSVTVWNDKSGNGYHMNTLPASASWTGTAAYPTIGTSMNGLQTVKFLAQSGLKQATTLDGVKNLFWVGRIAAPDGTAGPDAAPVYFLLGHDTLYDWHGDFYGSKFVTTGAAQSGITSATASLFTSDSNAVTNATFGNVNMPSAPNVSLLSVSGITGSTRYQGICYDRNIHPGWCGDLAEVLIYSTALTTSQRQQVEGYLAQKWGLTGSLPSSHPFKKLPA
jgi:hypothetical protein